MPRSRIKGRSEKTDPLGSRSRSNHINRSNGSESSRSAGRNLVASGKKERADPTPLCVRSKLPAASMRFGASWRATEATAPKPQTQLRRCRIRVGWKEVAVRLLDHRAKRGWRTGTRPSRELASSGRGRARSRPSWTPRLGDTACHDAATFTAVLHLVCRGRGDWRRAMSLLRDDMPEAGVDPDAHAAGRHHGLPRGSGGRARAATGRTGRCSRHGRQRGRQQQQQQWWWWWFVAHSGANAHTIVRCLEMRAWWSLDRRISSTTCCGRGERSPAGTVARRERGTGRRKASAPLRPVTTAPGAPPPTDGVLGGRHQRCWSRGAGARPGAAELRASRRSAALRVLLRAAAMVLVAAVVGVGRSRAAEQPRRRLRRRHGTTPTRPSAWRRRALERSAGGPRGARRWWRSARRRKRPAAATATTNADCSAEPHFLHRGALGVGQGAPFVALGGGEALFLYAGQVRGSMTASYTRLLSAHAREGQWRRALTIITRCGRRTTAEGSAARRRTRARAPRLGRTSSHARGEGVRRGRPAGGGAGGLRAHAARRALGEPDATSSHLICACETINRDLITGADAVEAVVDDMDRGFSVERPLLVINTATVTLLSSPPPRRRRRASHETQCRGADEGEEETKAVGPFVATRVVDFAAEALTAAAAAAFAPRAEKAASPSDSRREGGRGRAGTRARRGKEEEAHSRRQGAAATPFYSSSPSPPPPPSSLFVC